MVLSTATAELTLTSAADPVARAAVTQCYACVPEALSGVAVGQHILLHEAAALARERWGTGRILIDAQVVDVRPGTYPGMPVWSSTPESSTDEVLIACLADEVLLEFQIAGETVPGAHDRLLAVPSGTRLRFRAPTREQQTVIVLLLRPQDGLRAWNLPRHCARVFSSTYNGTARPAGTVELPAWSRKPTLHFRSQLELLDRLPQFSEAQIAAEPLYNGASVAFARATGGPLMQAYLDRMPAAWYADPDLIIQVKRDELSPGWSPALLEWHMDGTSRAEKRSDGTPDLRRPGRQAQQLAACIGRVSPTALLAGDLTLPEVPEHADRELARHVWHVRIQEHLARGEVRATVAPCNQLFLFGWGGFHACSVAQEPGWRCFIKAMRGRGDVPANRMARRNAVAWPSDGTIWPSDPLGVFPQDLPFA